MRIPALPTLLKQLGASSRPIRSFSVEKGKVAVEFEPLVPQAPKELAPTKETRIEFVPGTSIPADKSPLNPLDTLLNVPQFNANEVS